MSRRGRVSYTVCACISFIDPRRRPSQRRRVTASRNIRFTPAGDAEPSGDKHQSSRYAVQTERVVKRGPLSSILGILNVASTYPNPIQYSLSDCITRDTPSPNTTPQLLFHPSGKDSIPPQIYALRTKLVPHTSLSTARTPEEHPCRSIDQQIPPSQPLFHTETVPLPDLDLVPIQWTEQDKHLSSPESGSCSNNPSDTEISSISGPYYTATIVVPFTLPETKSFVPSFSSCLISRSYSLDIKLLYQSSGGGVCLVKRGVSLRVPLLIKR